MASILKVDTIQDQSGNNIINENADTITIGASGDTVDVPGTEVKTNKVSPTSGTTLTLGDSGDTITIPSGATLSSTDPLVFPAGTASLPAVTTTGDTNTGIFFPAADTIAFTEGGAEAMRIDSSGEVGINTTNPQYPLHVNGTIHCGVSGSSSGSVTGTLSIGNTGTYYMTLIKTINTQGTPSILKARMGFFTLSGTGETAVDATEKMSILADSGNVGIGETNPTSKLRVNGSLSKASGSFQIDHPLENKKDTHYLVHSFVESPQANNIYRGKINLINGTATVNLDIVSGMSEGTFVLLNREIQCFTSNETGWTAVKGSVSGNILTITAQDETCTDTISWLVIGERQDQHMYDTEWTDENGKVIVEPLKPKISENS